MHSSHPREVMNGVSNLMGPMLKLHSVQASTTRVSEYWMRYDDISRVLEDGSLDFQIVRFVLLPPKNGFGRIHNINEAIATDGYLRGGTSDGLPIPSVPMMDAETSGNRIGSNDPCIARGVDADVATGTGHDLPLISFSPEDNAIGIHDPGIAHAIDVDSNRAAIHGSPVSAGPAIDAVTASNRVGPDNPNVAASANADVTCSAGQLDPLISFSPKDEPIRVHDPGVAGTIDVDSNRAAVDTIPLIPGSVEN